MEKVDKVITCPHCKELIGVIPREIKVIKKEEEIALNTGDCVDCEFAWILSKEEMDYQNQGLAPADSGKKVIAFCEMEHDRHIFFTKEDFRDKKNSCASGFCIPDGEGCFAFKKRDKKIDFDTL